MAMQETGAKRTKTASSLLLKNSSSVQSFKEKQKLKLTVTLCEQLLCTGQSSELLKFLLLLPCLLHYTESTPVNCCLSETSQISCAI